MKNSKKQIVCVIPARLHSKRFPKKVLAKVGEKSMLELVWEAAKQCPQFSAVYFAIDSEETAKVIDAFKGEYLMTSQECPSGTHRLIEVMEKGVVDADVWVNWQADEPFISSKMIQDLLQGIDQGGAVWTLKKKIDPQDIENPDVVKVVTDKANRALYFSRSPIPFDRDGSSPQIYKHIGLYAYSTDALKKIATWRPSPLAKAEKLEQLQFLEEGLSIQVYPTTETAIGIDTPQDLLRASLLLK